MELGQFKQRRLTNISSLRHQFWELLFPSPKRNRSVLLVRFSGDADRPPTDGHCAYVEAQTIAGMIAFEPSFLIFDFRRVKPLHPDVMEFAIHAAKDPVTSRRIPFVLLLPECTFPLQATLRGCLQKDVRTADYVASDLRSACQKVLRKNERLPSQASIDRGLAALERMVHATSRRKR